MACPMSPSSAPVYLSSTVWVAASKESVPRQHGSEQVWAYFHATVGCSYVRVIALAAFFNAWLLGMFIDFYSKSYKKA